MATCARPGVVLAICCVSVFIVGMDSSILNVALPSIKQAFDANISGAQWTLDAYTLTLASFLMLSASTADRIGRRKVFQTGLVVFTAGSLLCSLAPTLETLTVFRALQAVGGSMLNPVAMSIITNTFTEPRERARAIGVWGGVVGVSVAAGPLIGGALVEFVGWRSVFWVNVPIGIAAFVLAKLHVPESRAPHPRKIDPAGQILVIGTVFLLTFGIIEAPNTGWGSPQTVLSLLGSAVCLGALIVVERHRPEPLIDVRFFKAPPFAGATGIALLMYTAQGGFLIVNTLYLQVVKGLSPFEAGLSILPMPLLQALTGPISGRVVGRYGPRPSIVLGTAGSISAGLLAAVPADLPTGARMYLCYALMGFGLGWLNAAITTTAVSGMPNAQAGVAASIVSTMRQTGVTLGVAVVGSVVASHVTVLAAGPGFTAAYRISWAIIIACGALVLTIGLVTTGRWAQRAVYKQVHKHPLEKMWHP
ncbi:MFS transporter [Herbidospora sp. NBRC 101105]|uniref:MFS transporter n=1 Tax=Herbidospora sp. NBRC 101105 TaxID=3032195 RepID=UPI0025533EB0|nr:MFS transporter [Herbidospora sp. NBRC 101105]